MLRKILILTALAFSFCYGFGIAKFQWPPYSTVQRLKEEIAPSRQVVEHGFPRRDPVTDRSEHYLQKLSIFAQSHRPAEVVLIGDSITTNGNWDELLPRVRVANRGIGGDTTFGVLDRLDEALAMKPSLAFLMIGVNDLGYRIDKETILSNIARIVETIQAKGTTPVLQSILYVGRRDANHRSNKDIEYLNTRLHTWAAQHHVVFVDLNPSLVEDGYLDDSLTNDGVHILGEAYAIWADRIEAIIESVLLSASEPRDSSLATSG